jgi:diacylglycerol kinase
MGHNHPIVKSFKYAFEGLSTALKQEPNMRFHFVVGFIAIVLGFIVKLNPTEWAILTLTISIVVILELLNTTIEELVDLASPSIHPKAKIAKDVAAAAVLWSSFAAIIVGCLLFLPKIF